METGNNQEQLSRKQRKKLNRQNRAAAQTQQQSPLVSRRDVLKAMIPGGWIGEARRKGIGNLSTAGKVSLVKDAALVLGPAVLLGTKQEKPQKEATLKEKILSFTWEDAKNEEKLKAFTNQLAESYLSTTNTSRLKKEDLVGEGVTSFYQDTNSYVDAVRKVSPSYSPSKTQWGYTHFDSKKVFIDFANLKRQSQEQNGEAGLALTDALWHEWGHLDVTDRTTGELLNNPQVHFLSPNSGKDEVFRRYRGAEVFTDTYYGFARFEEVLNETITVRRMIEQVGLEEVISARDYYNNGVEVFSRFTSAHIPLEDLYQMHANSDFEGLAKNVGQNLPGDIPPLERGVGLFTGIHQANPLLIEKTGVFSMIPSPNP